MQNAPRILFFSSCYVFLFVFEQAPKCSFMETSVRCQKINSKTKSVSTCVHVNLSPLFCVRPRIRRINDYTSFIRSAFNFTQRPCVKLFNSQGSVTIHHLWLLLYQGRSLRCTILLYLKRKCLVLFYFLGCYFVIFYNILSF